MAIGLGLALIFGLLYVYFYGIVATYFLVCAIISTATATYIAYIISTQRPRAGLLTLPALVLAIGLLLCYFATPLAVFLLINTLALSLTRGFIYSYRTPQIILDLTLSLIAIPTAYWAWRQTHSWLIASWSYFLIHALISADIFSILCTNKNTSELANNHFFRAQRNAENAIKRVLNHRL